ncbi:hypothetical protein OG601_24150 [Streptomyces sp. NBC_01239]|uniref:hypothetical protein n=1 Tax=Streptomyces sp. NBC_01239 TaxID=2903792 RepID=UPI002256B70D|nr:hypothetical protein [Streptomyces sp. NBC_01239]MCX4813695.1 hypothetical protein [Streptomyces sp. NBC_01239]
MPDTYTVDTIEEYFPKPDVPCWVVRFVKPDGNGHHYIFPQDTLVSRAAEYDIDPMDVDTLLDIVLHEQFVNPDDDDKVTAGMRSPALKNQGKFRKGDLMPTNLFNAPTIEHARDAHLARIDYAKKNKVQVSVPKKNNPLDAVKIRHLEICTDVAFKEKREAARNYRAAVRGELPKNI